MQKLYAILVDGTVYFSWLFIVSMGLTLIYGVMKILNIAHGSFYALGAYTAASAVGAYFAGRLSGRRQLPAARSRRHRGRRVRRLPGRARPAAADVRARRDRAGARHLCRVPGVRGSDQARLGRRSVFRLSALRAARPGLDRRHRLCRLRSRPAGARGRHRRRGLVGAGAHAVGQAAARGDPRPRDQRPPWASTWRACSRRPSSSAPCSARSAAR